MKLLIALSLAGFIAAGQAQPTDLNSCPETELCFLIDQSENAKRAASTSNESFTILKDQLSAFLEFIGAVRNLTKFRLGIITYSSSSSPQIIVPRGSTVAEAKPHINQIGTGLIGGSWTFKAFEPIDSPAQNKNNWLLVITSQGSSLMHKDHVNLTKQAVDRVTGLGWRTRVIVVKGKNEINEEELTYVNKGQPLTILNDGNEEDPKSYLLLGDELKLFFKEICP